MSENMKRILVLGGVAAGLYLAYKHGNDMVKGVATVAAGAVAVKQIPFLNQVAA